jgi:hypothetical protein
VTRFLRLPEMLVPRPVNGPRELPVGRTMPFGNGLLSWPAGVRPPLLVARYAVWLENSKPEPGIAIRLSTSGLHEVTEDRMQIRNRKFTRKPRAFRAAI